MHGSVVHSHSCLNAIASHKTSFVTVADKTPFGTQAEVTLKTNFFATRDMCNEFLPIIKPGGKSNTRQTLPHPPKFFSHTCITSG